MAPTWVHDSKSGWLTEDEKSKLISIVMKLSYLPQQTRPDILFAVNKLAQYQNANPTKSDWGALIRILRYLRKTWDLGLHYKNEITTPCAITNDPDVIPELIFNIPGENQPEGFADASYGEEPDRKSRSGYVFLFGGAAISWYSKKQVSVSLSSTEAEYYSLGDAVKESIWIKQLMDELGLQIENPITINQDNMSTMAIAINPIQHQKTKHIDIRMHFIREHLERKNIKLAHCPTENMIADILTKALPPSQHGKLTKMMGLESLSEIHMLPLT
jgi:hypothetical protein